MKKYVRKLLAVLLVMAMLVTDAVPAMARTRHQNDAHASHVELATEPTVDFSKISDDVFDAIADYLANGKEEAKSAFGKYVEGHKTADLKAAIWKAIFVDREYNVIDFAGLGLSQETAEGLTEEVLVEANAEEAVAYTVEADAEGDATTMTVAIDPMYSAAYAEIEMATANVEATAEGDAQEPTMEDAIKAFNEYQGFVDAYPDVFGITVPYNSVKDDANEGGGPITSLVTIANAKMDMNQDGVIDANDDVTGDGQPEYMLDLFKMGYIPAADLVQLINMFHLGNVLGAKLLGEELGDSVKAALTGMPSKATDVQKLLYLNDWLADLASFDMASIMNLDAPQPTTPDILNTLMYVLTSEDFGLSQAEAEQLAPQLLGLWAGTQFGVMTPSMGYKGVCMGYTYAYALLVQYAFSNVYKNADGTWKSRLELNYIPNPAKATVAVALAEELEEVPSEDTEDTAASSENTEDTAASSENTEDTAASSENTEDTAASSENTEDTAASSENTEDTAASSENTEDTAASSENTEDTAASSENTEDTAASSENTEDTATSSENTEDTTDDATDDEPETPVAHEHTFDTATEPAAFSWSADYTKANAVFECTAEDCEGGEGSTKEVPATVTVEEVPATCTTAGTVTYTASYTVGEGEAAVVYTDEKTKEIPATGHKDENGVCTVCGLADYIWDPSAPAMVDFVRISYNADVTMYGQPQPTFESDHYWNAVKVDGKWYYVDPCYTDIYVECMIRDRVETDGNMSHLYFMFSDTNARTLYDGNFKSIDTLYEGVATDTTYEDAWFAFARSPITRSGDKYYYFYDSTDMIDLTTNTGNSYDQEDTEYKLVAHNASAADNSTSFTTLIDFVSGQVRVVENGTAKMVDNDLIERLAEEHEAYQEEYPSIGISCDIVGTKLYFNLANCILSYDIETGAVEKVFEYNEVTAERDLTMGLGGMAFTVIDGPEDAETTEYNGEATVITVENNPIASMTIKNGNMYVSIGTTLGFISGKKSMSDEDTSIGYQFEETNYNAGYVEYVMSNGQLSSENGNNDNDEFMWSANFVDVIPMDHITKGEHTYEAVHVAATCGENAYTEMRCTDCGAIKADSRNDFEGTALEHHYVEFEETYYTKTGDAWNTGTSYVCTICKDAYEEDEFEEEGLEKSAHNYVCHVTAWNKDYTEATVDIACEACYGVNYDCVLEDDAVVLATGVKTTNVTKTDRFAHVVDIEEETEVREFYWIYDVAAEYDADGDGTKETYTGTDWVAREEDKYDNIPFSDVTYKDWFVDAVLWAADNKVTAGYEDGTFRPNASSTRAQVVTFLWNKAGQPTPTTTENPFPDVVESDWYYKAVLWAAENGITAGYEDGTFRPNDICTRAHVVTFLWNSVKQPAPKTTENPFPDVAEGEWYYKAVLWAAENNVTAGYEDGTFRPTKDCTRAEIVQLLYNYYQ